MQTKFVVDAVPLEPDTDSDGAVDGAEITAGSDPLIVDTDGDGCADGEDLALGLNPLILDFWDMPLPAGPPATGAKDKVVDISDIVGMLSKAFTTVGGPPNGNGQVYNSEFDIAGGTSPPPPGDGVIDTSDIVLVIGQVFVNCAAPP
jgi:hypothetical protein